MTHKIFYGIETLAILVGKHQINLGIFAYEHRGWHSYRHNDRSAVRAIRALVKKGYLQNSRKTSQFRWIG